MLGFSKAGLKGYSPEKAAQAAAYFTLKHNKSIDKLKLIKLLYLAERESVKQRTRPMFYDEFYSLEHGPICSNALNGINGRADSGIWRRYISLDANKRTVRARARNEFPRLSASDLEVINSVWKEFGHKSTTAIRKWTHDHCPEYTPVETGRVPINYKDMFEAVGYANASDLEDSISQYRRSEALLDF